MRAADRRELENQLVRMGLNRLTNPELVPQMARLIRDHDWFLGMLNSCDQDKRTEMYEALRPHLKFTPYPLDVYMSKIREHAANVESWSEPIKIGDQEFEMVSRDQATGAVVDMKCSKCSRTASFYGDTPLEAVILARQEGWARERGIDKELCPKCPCPDRSKRQKCPTCQRRHHAPNCRVRDTVMGNMDALSPKRTETIH